MSPIAPHLVYVLLIVVSKLMVFRFSLRQAANLRHAACNHRAFGSNSVLLRLPSHVYEEMVQRGDIAKDDRQVKALEKLDALIEQLESWVAAPAPPPAPQGGFFNALFGGGSPQNASEESHKSTLSDIPGVYMYGGVGCGKSFLMDLFYNQVPLNEKKRVHFNQFMLGVHQGIHRHKKLDRRSDGIEQVVDELASEASVLCFDEVQVNDIADAMILRRLFSAIYARGLVVVATSNRAPGELYKGGLNREVFLPFIDLVKAQNVVHDMQVSRVVVAKRKSNRQCHPLAVFPKAKGEESRHHTALDNVRELHLVAVCMGMGCG